MKEHPFVDSPYRWILVLILALILFVGQVSLICGYTGAEYVPAAIDGVATVGWLFFLAYSAWFIVGFVSLARTDVITVAVGTVMWLVGCFMVCDVMVRMEGLSYIPFAPTIPFRLLFGVPALTAVVLWYRLIAWRRSTFQEREQEYVEKHESLPAPQVETMDRITVKDGSRIHLIEVDELLYIQACGDYVTLNTAMGEYVKEQTMKYFEAQLPTDTFVRIHRSTIVNVTQISRLELFGKETYLLLLKNGVKLKVSLSGYRLLKEKLGL